MKQLNAKIFIILFLSSFLANCGIKKENTSNPSTELNSNNSSVLNKNTNSAINQSDYAKMDEKFNLIGRWKHVSSQLSALADPVFIQDSDIYFTFEENGKGIYTKTPKGVPEQKGDSNNFKWKWKDEKTLILDKIRDEKLEVEVLDKGPRHLALKVKDKLAIRFLLQKPIE